MKQPSLSGVTAISKTPPPVRTLFSRLNRGPNRGREKTSLCLSYSAASVASSDHDLQIERGAGRWNRRVSGFLPPRKDSCTRLRTGSVPESRLPKPVPPLQAPSRLTAESCSTLSPTVVFGRPPSLRFDPRRRDRADGRFRRQPNLLSGNPASVWMLSYATPPCRHKVPLDNSLSHA